MKRRDFLKIVGVGAVALELPVVSCVSAPDKPVINTSTLLDYPQRAYHLPNRNWATTFDLAREAWEADVEGRDPDFGRVLPCTVSPSWVTATVDRERGEVRVVLDSSEGVEGRCGLYHEDTVYMYSESSGDGVFMDSESPGDWGYSLHFDPCGHEA